MIIVCITSFNLNVDVNQFELEVQKDYYAMRIVDKLLNELIDLTKCLKSHLENILIWVDVIGGQNNNTNTILNA